MTAPATRALTRPAVVDDRHVAELGALAVAATKRRAAGDDTAADARPEREHHEIVDAASRAGAPLADRRRVRVVFQANRQTESLAHVIAERRVLERQVHAANDDPALLVDRRRRPNPIAPTESSSSSVTAASSSAMTCSCESCGVARS